MNAVLVPLAHLGHFVAVAPFVMPPLLVAGGLAVLAVADRLRSRS